MNNEIWKDIYGYEGRYLVSNIGRIKSIRKGKETIIALHSDSDGYLITHLSKDGKRKNVRVHRVVAEAFIHNPCNLPQINHKDEDKTNNAVWNLEWCDCAYNINYGARNREVSVKLQKQVTQSSGGKIIKRWGSLSEIGSSLGFDISNISKCCRGIIKKAYGFTWQFV